MAPKYHKAPTLVAIYCSTIGMRAYTAPFAAVFSSEAASIKPPAAGGGVPPLAVAVSVAHAFARERSDAGHRPAVFELSAVGAEAASQRRCHERGLDRMARNIG